MLIERGPVLQSFLASIPNPYLHFGDIDLPGIAIFQNEYLPIVKNRGEFLIPRDVERILKEKGRGELHEIHIKKYANLASTSPKIVSLIALIKKSRKRLAQEYFAQS